MDPLNTDFLPRNVIQEFIKSPRGVVNYEAIQSDTVNLYAAITQASFLTLGSDPNLGSERILTLASGELEGADDGPGTIYTLGLADTAIAAGDYGDESNLVKIRFDAKGRAIAAESFELNSDNVTEGTTNLFFTVARARAALSDGPGVDYNSTTGVIAVSPAGAYGTPTGTLSRASFATYSAPVISNPPTQAEVQAVADALQVVSRTLAALITDLEANGNLT